MNIILTREQVRHVDQLAIERYGMTGLVLMENAGRNAAEVIQNTYGPGGRALIVCGRGNNGGDGFVIARHLHNAGWTVGLLLSAEPETMAADARANFEIVEAMTRRHGAPTYEVVTSSEESSRELTASLGGGAIVVDALLGTGFHGQVRHRMAGLIESINDASKRAVVAIDVPSGLDCDTGMASNATVRADLTVTFVAAKRGFSATAAAPFLGRVEVVDIGVPRELIDEIADFSES